MVKGLLKTPVKLLTIFAGIIYILMPVDLIPVVIFGPIGLIDDFLVFLMILGVWRGKTLSESLSDATKFKNIRRGG